MSVEIKKVESKKDLKKFIEFHYTLYKGNKFDAPNLYSDDKRTLSKDKNSAFDFCEAEYFLAYKDGKLVGRVAAIINHRANERWNHKRVRFGWIDFIDDIEVSGALLDAVAEYGRSKGMNEIVGPLGFTDMDPEGMLTDGFDQLGTMATIYNYPYYPEHMERLGGYEKDNDYVEYKLFVPDTVPEKFAKIADMVQRRYNLRIKKLTKKDIFEDGYGRKLFEALNEAMKDLYEYSELSDKQIDEYVKMYLPMIDLDFVTVIEDGNNGKVVGAGVCLLSLTKALQKCRKGRLLPFGWWHILRVLKWHKADIVDCLLIGVLPEYRPKGANALLFSDLIPRFHALGLKWGETHVEMETNGKVQSQWQHLDHELHKRRRCYKKDI
ncbi:MAG: N-acetyltransferase [Prevotella sp.]|nr:N-acetyltransferase [Prevotella sp.]